MPKKRQDGGALAPSKPRAVCYAEGGKDCEPIWYWHEPDLEGYMWGYLDDPLTGISNRVLVAELKVFDENDEPGDCDDHPFFVQHKRHVVLFTDDLTWEPSFPVLWDSAK